MKSHRMQSSLLVVVVSWSAVATLEAVEIPIVNPTFDAPVAGSGFIYEDAFYTAGNPMPDHTFTFNPAMLEGNENGEASLGDSATGAGIDNAGVEMIGYTGSPGTGLLHDTRDYLPGQGPDGPGAVVGFVDDLPRGIFQTLSTAFEPNTTYTFTAEVSDRRFGVGDNLSFPSGGDVVPLGIQLSLSGDVEPEPVSLTFTQPEPGGTSLATYVFTTGPMGTPGDPTGDITLVLRAQGFTPGPGIAATQVVFDNLMLDATPAEPPIGVTGDYNGDDKVDAADYVVWRANLGASIALPNEDATPGTVTQEDYTVWTNNFGKMAGSGTGSTSAATVPEPAGAWLLLFAFFVLVSFSTFCRDGRWRAAGGPWRNHDCPAIPME